MKNKNNLASLLESCVSLCMLALLFWQPVYAVTVVEHSAEEMLQRADEVFYGQVTDIYSQQIFNEQGGQIFTFVQFSNIKRVKNTDVLPNETYLLRIAGGRLANTVQMYPGIPQFVLGERYVVFIRDNQKIAFPLVGIQQGFVHVKSSLNGRFKLIFNASNQKLKTHFLGVKNQFLQHADEKNIDPEDFIFTLREYWLLRKSPLNAVQTN